jgi:hypothetical protein
LVGRLNHAADRAFSIATVIDQLFQRASASAGVATRFALSSEIGAPYGFGI